MGFQKLNSPCEFQALESSLVQLLPKSSQMNNLIRLAILDQFPKESCNDFYFYHDDLDNKEGTTPDVIKMIDPCKLFIVCIQIPNIFSPYCVITLTPDPVSPSMVAAFDTLVDWERVHLFSQAEHANFGPHLEQLCIKHGQNHGKTKIKYDGILFALDPAIALTYDLPRLEPNLKIGSLQVSHAPEVISNWVMAQPHSLHPVEDAIANFPSLGIYAEVKVEDDVKVKGDGSNPSAQTLISSAIMSTMGLINVVYTQDAWRRQGLGGVTVGSLANKIASQGLIPCAEIEKGNVKSEAMLIKAGFKPVLDTVWLYLQNDDNPMNDKE